MSIFTTTRWSLVLAARGSGRDAGAALDALCRAYRPAVLAYIRARGHDRTEAEDLTQAFFERFLSRHVHAAADPTRGRFRTFLRTTLQNYLINEASAARTQKRGGGTRAESLEEAGASEVLSPDEAFDLAWAVTVCDRAVLRLREEAAAAGRDEQFSALEPFLLERPEQREYVAVAARLGMRANTVAVAVRRLRERLRDLIHAELADTVDGQDGMEAERRALQALLATH